MKTSIMKAMNAALTILVGMGVLLGSLSMSIAAEKPKPGGTFVVGLHADPPNLNPVVTLDAVATCVSYNIFSRLIYADIKGNYFGDLAEKWAISKDNLRIKFDLRKGLKWHDGHPLTAEDVKFSLESMAKYNSRAGELKRISEIRILSDRSLEIRFPTPSVIFFPFLDEGGFIIPKHIYGGSEDITTDPSNSKPVGSGPFAFQEWKKGDHITLVRNKNYYIPGEPFVDKVVFRIIPSGVSRVLSLETGDIDYLAERELPETDIPRLKKNPNFVVTNQGMTPTPLNYLLFNLRRKPWDDVRVRRAVAHAVDRQVVVEKGTFGLAQPAYSPFSKSSWPWAYNPKVENMYPFDPARAGKLLEEAGYPAGPEGVRFKTTVVFDRSDSRAMDTTEVIREQLKRVGIEIVMQPMEKATLIQMVWVRADFDIWSGPAFQGSDPASGIERLFITEAIPPVPSVHNGGGYSNPQVDKLFTLARTTMDIKKRGQYYRDVQLILLKDLPTLPLTDTPKFAAFPTKVKGVNERHSYAHKFAPMDAWFSQ